MANAVAYCIVVAMTEPADPDTPSEIPLASRLCLACGLCCDGTVYPHAVAREDEVERAVDLGFTAIRTDDGSPAYSLPCHYLKDRACTRYLDWRPSVCGDYFCRVQARAASGEITEDEALERIAKAQTLRDAVFAELPADLDQSKARQHLADLASRGGKLEPAGATFTMRMFALERYLDSEFRLADHDRLMTRRAQEK